jgi:putative salt-induced outer membrane protein YdiY
MKSTLNPYLLAAALLAAGASTGLPQAQDAALQKQPTWEKSAAAGLTLTRGNSDTLLATASLLASKKWGPHEMNLGADASYGEVDDVKNAESLHGFAQYNRLFNERLFGYLRVDALHDDVADLAYRFTFSPGVGYYFIKATNTTLRGEVGPAFIYEKQGQEEQGYFSLRLAERFDHKFNERVRVWQSLEILPQVDDWENYIINAELGLEAGLTQKLSLRTFLQDTYDNQPAPGRRKNDLKLVSALAYKF